MSYLEQLRSRRRTPKSVWHKLKTSINTDKYRFYLVFEGEEDEDFFSGFVENRLAGVPFRPIICDGKGGVLAVQQEMIDHFGDFRNVFFVIDSDHDEFIGTADYPEQAFNTCGYSVENYLQCTETCTAAIKKCYQLRDSDPLVQHVEARVSSDFKTFEKRASSIMTYVVALRRNDQVLSLDDLHFSDVFEFTELGLSKKKIDCEKLCSSVGAGVELGFGDFLSTLRELGDNKPTEIIRGKLVAQFILHLIKGVPSFFKGQTKLNGRELKSRVDLGKKNILHVVSEFIEIPPRFDEFIDGIEVSLSG